MQSAASRATAAQIVAWMLLLAAILFLSLRGWGSFQLGVYQDDAIYVVLARSIAGGETYGLINQPGVPDGKFPFVFPLVLAPVVALFPDDLDALTAVPLLATVLNSSLLFWGWPLLSRTSRWWGLAAAALLGLAPLTIGMTHIVFSEPVFTTFVLLSLLALEACVRRSQRTWSLPLAVGALLALALFTRLVGIAIVVAAGLRLAFAGRWRDLVLAGAGGVACVGVALAATTVELHHLLPKRYALELEAGRTHQGRPMSPESRLPIAWSVIEAYAARDIRIAIVPVGGGDAERNFGQRVLGVSWVPEAVGFLVTAITFAGFVLAVGRGLLTPGVLLFQLVYGGGLVVWHWDNVRFLYPVQPFLQVQFLFGLAAIGDLLERVRLPQRTGSAIAAAVCALFLLASFWRSLTAEDSRGLSRDLTVGASWIAANVPPEALLAARYPESVYVHARRKTIPLPRRPELEQALAEQHVDYAMVAPMLRWGQPLELDEPDAEVGAALDEMVARGDAEVVYQSDPSLMVRVYHIKRTPL